MRTGLPPIFRSKCNLSGAQWTLSSFFDDPEQPFILFRQIGSNIYADVLASLGTLLRLLAAARVKGITQTIAEQKETQNGHRNQSTGEHNEMNSACEIRTGITEHIAPCWYGWLHT